MSNRKRCRDCTKYRYTGEYQKLLDMDSYPGEWDGRWFTFDGVCSKREWTSSWNRACDQFVQKLQQINHEKRCSICGLIPFDSRFNYCPACGERLTDG